MPGASFGAPTINSAHRRGPLFTQALMGNINLEPEREAWAPIACALLGAWLVASPWALAYSHEWIAWSDWASGALVVALGAWALGARRALAMWLLCLLGVWLLHAPLVFWTTSAAAYLNGTVIGILLIAFSVVIPRQHWSAQRSEPDVPPGWTFNPSSWAQRSPIIALAWINFFLARYLAAYQLDHIPWPWDPLFGDGTQRVLDSDVSEAFPVSDAGLGAAAYALEAMIGYMGTASRWRTAPWTVALFGVLVIPVGVVSTVLMILQPVAVGAWCTICLVAAALMIVMACLALPEVVAMVQCLMRSHRAGRGAWRTFWRGGDDVGGTTEAPAPQFSGSWGVLGRAMVRGTTLPWTLLLSTAVGIAFVAAPDVLGIFGLVGDAHVIVGALVIVLAILAMAEVGRVLRWGNIPLGVVMALLVWVSEGVPMSARIVTTVLAVVLMAASVPRGAVRERYGGWDRAVR